MLTLNVTTAQMRRIHSAAALAAEWMAARAAEWRDLPADADIYGAGQTATAYGCGVEWAGFMPVRTNDGDQLVPTNRVMAAAMRAAIREELDPKSIGFELAVADATDWAGSRSLGLVAALTR